MGQRAKRWLYVTHRWIGIASCVLFAMWFMSGLVMIYVPFPELTRTERLAGLSPIDWGKVRIGPAAAMLAVSAPSATLTLEMRGSGPVWRAVPDFGPEVDISATDGRRLGPTDAAEARIAAASFGRAPIAALRLIERDQWSVPGGFDRHRPLWKATLADPDGRVLYVSSRTGAVVLDTNRVERFWNWLGSVPHWLYPTVLRQDNAAWRQVVMWVSGPCIVAAVTGFWIGIIRTRVGRRRYKDGRVTPYRGWMEWHHLAGLIGGVALIGWIFSGWLSVDPFRLFASGGIAPAARAAYDGPGAPPGTNPARLAGVAVGARQVELRWLTGRPLLAISGADGTEAVREAATLQPYRPDPAMLVRAASRLLPNVRIERVERLTEPDAYWYEMSGDPILPVLRIEFADAAHTWVHLDPATGKLLNSTDARRRLYRWLFDLLHKWDLNLLTRHRPAWDAVLWLFSLCGIVTSLSGIYIGSSRLTRRRASTTVPGSRPTGSCKGADIAAMKRDRTVRRV